MICVPAVAMGSILYLKYGIYGALSSIVIGSLILMIISILPIKMCQINRYNAAQVVDFYFTDKISSFIAALMVILSLGWFGVQLDFIASFLHNFSKEYCNVNLNVFKIFLGFLVIFICLFNVKGLSIFAAISSPVLIILIIFTIYRAAATDIGRNNIALQFCNSFYIDGVIYFISSFLLGIFFTPDYYRFSRSKKDSYIALILVFTVGSIGVSLGGVLITLFSGKNFIDYIAKTDNLVVNLIICFLLILSGSGANNGNLYSSSVAICRICKQISHKKSVAICGCAGIMFSILNIASNLLLFLDFLGIIISSVSILMWMNFIFDRLKMNTNNNIKIINGCGLFSSLLIFGFLLEKPIVSGSIVLDSILYTASYVAIFRLLMLLNLKLYIFRKNKLPPLSI